MKIDWSAFLAVFTVSLGATVVVAILVSVALVEISARREPEVTHIRHAIFTTRLGGVIAAACLVAVLALGRFGLSLPGSGGRSAGARWPGAGRPQRSTRIFMRRPARSSS